MEYKMPIKTEIKINKLDKIGGGGWNEKKSVQARNVCAGKRPETK